MLTRRMLRKFDIFYKRFPTIVTLGLIILILLILKQLYNLQPDKSLYTQVGILNIQRASSVEVSTQIAYSKEISTQIAYSVEISTQIVSSEFKRNNLNFNKLVQEDENVAQEEIEHAIIGKENYVTSGPYDLNAAFEVHSHEQDFKSRKIFNKSLIKSKIEHYISDRTWHKEGINSGFSQSLFSQRENINKDAKFFVWEKSKLEAKGLWNFRNFSVQHINSLSILGRRMFLHENIGHVQNKKFLIYVYLFGKKLENRLIKKYDSKWHDPFEKCSVRNCQLSYRKSDFNRSDAVLFHLHRIQGPPVDLKRENFNQKWVWMSDEGPYNTFMLGKDKNIDHYSNIFNWSMTYRSDSDVPVPYGRTIPLLENASFTMKDLDIFSKKKKTVAVMGSNCSGKNHRWEYIKELQKYVDIDTYGRCGRLKCAGHFNKDCPLLNEYKFYLAFENSNCKEYITEKAWWNAFKKDSVPIVMGSHKDDYLKLFPPNSFIYVEDFSSPKELAEYIKYLAENKEAYNRYFLWKLKYQVVNEHGYFQSNVFHYCRLCEALNYNLLTPKTYDTLTSYWDISRDCFASKWL